MKTFYMKFVRPLFTNVYVSLFLNLCIASAIAEYFVVDKGLQFLAMGVILLIQHWIDIKIGMYDDITR